MEGVVCKGLVIRQSNFAEADRILTIFTEEMGIIRAVAKGARKFGSHQGAAAQFLNFAQFTLHPGKNMYTLRGASQIESFFKLSESVEKLALATYLCELTQAFTAEGTREPEILKLLLNTLYLLAEKVRPLLLIKAVYELRLSSLAGFEAQCDKCVRCGASDGLTHFSAAEGGVLCASCVASNQKSVKISDASRAAMVYILRGKTERIFAFEVSEPVLLELSALAENFVLLHAEKELFSLSYLKNLI